MALRKMSMVVIFVNVKSLLFVLPSVVCDTVRMVLNRTLMAVTYVNVSSHLAVAILHVVWNVSLAL